MLHFPDHKIHTPTAFFPRTLPLCLFHVMEVSLLPYQANSFPCTLGSSLSKTSFLQFSPFSPAASTSPFSPGHSHKYIMRSSTFYLKNPPPFWFLLQILPLFSAPCTTLFLKTSLSLLSPIFLLPFFPKPTPIRWMFSPHHRNGFCPVHRWHLSCRGHSLPLSFDSWILRLDRNTFYQGYHDTALSCFSSCSYSSPLQWFFCSSARHLNIGRSYSSVLDLLFLNPLFLDDNL